VPVTDIARCDVAGHFPQNRLVRNLYRGLKQLFQTALSQTSRSFQQVALIEYPRKGVYRIGLQTSEAVAEIQSVTRQDLVTVFVPNTANIASGFTVFVPRAETIELTMSVEDALKLIVSLGVVVPEWQPTEAQPSLAPTTRSP